MPPIYLLTYYCSKPYCLCIPNGIYNNSSFPLGFVIEPSENSDLYLSMYQDIEKLCDANLKSIPILVDMGIPLQSFSKKKSEEVLLSETHS